jgi:hypothetical protein
MLLLLGLIQLTIAMPPPTASPPPPGLLSVRRALTDADTSAALYALEQMLADTNRTPDLLAAVHLLDWIGRSSTYRGVVGRLNTNLEQDLGSATPVRGKAARPPPPDDDVVTVLRVWSALQANEEDMVASWLNERWQDYLDSLAVTAEADVPMLAGAARWVRVVDMLARLSRRAMSVRQAAWHAPQCARGCVMAGSPPPAYTLADRLEGRGPTEDLQTVTTLFAALSQAPWPYDALGARAHVAVCALLEGADIADCWPPTDRLVGRDLAEVLAMRYAFAGRNGLASRVMDATPGWFVALDSVREPLDVPDSVGAITLNVERHLSRIEPLPEALVKMPVDVFWRAARPLYLQPYNERLVVHRARVLLADAVQRLSMTDTPLLAPFGDPAIIVRTGVPLGIATVGWPVRATKSAPRTVPIVVYVPGAIHETLVRQGAVSPWVAIDLALASHPTVGRSVTGFVSEDYEVLGVPDHQLVHYVRDGRRHVDIYARWSPTLACSQARPLLGLFRFDTEFTEQARAVESDLTEHPSKRFTSVLDPGTYVFSLEFLDPGCRRAERARYWLRIPPAREVFLSDLMLADELFPGAMQHVTERVEDRQPVSVRPSLTVRAGGTARFYWETYGVIATAVEPDRLQVKFEVVDTQHQRVAISALQEVEGEARATPGTLDVTYTLVVPPGESGLACGIAVAVPADRRGLYVARVTVTDRKTNRTATAERAFYVGG